MIATSNFVAYGFVLRKVASDVNQKGVGTTHDVVVAMDLLSMRYISSNRNGRVWVPTIFWDYEMWLGAQQLFCFA